MASLADLQLRVERPIEAELRMAKTLGLGLSLTFTGSRSIWLGQRICINERQFPFCCVSIRFDSTRLDWIRIHFRFCERSSFGFRLSCLGSRVPTSNIKHQTANSKHRAASIELGRSVLLCAGCGRVELSPSFGLRTSDLELRAPNFELRTSPTSRKVRNKSALQTSRLAKSETQINQSARCNSSPVARCSDAEWAWRARTLAPADCSSMASSGERIN